MEEEYGDLLLVLSDLGGTPVVHRIYKITNPPEVFSEFEEYSKKIGNIQRRFHGK
jgi:hypothetical protein